MAPVGKSKNEDNVCAVDAKPSPIVAEKVTPRGKTSLCHIDRLPPTHIIARALSDGGNAVLNVSHTVMCAQAVVAAAFDTEMSFRDLMKSPLDESVHSQVSPSVSPPAASSNPKAPSRGVSLLEGSPRSFSRGDKNTIHSIQSASEIELAGGSQRSLRQISRMGSRSQISERNLAAVCPQEPPPSGSGMGVENHRVSRDKMKVMLSQLRQQFRLIENLEAKAVQDDFVNRWEYVYVFSVSENCDAK